MIREINASAIIACLAIKSKEPKVRINIKRVVEIGCNIERKHPSVFVDTDRYAFHSFASISKKAISVKDAEIVVDKSNPLLANRLNRMLPSEIVCKYIDEIVG